MRLPWNNKEKEEKIEELKEELEKTKEEKEKYRKRFQSEKERRSNLSREKQEAEEKLNKLQDKVEGLKQGETDEETVEEEELKGEDLSVERTVKSLEKLDSLNGEGLVTVYCPGKISDFSELKELKNSVDREVFETFSSLEGFAAYVDKDLGCWILDSRPFFGEKLSIGESFDASAISSFIKKSKVWALVSAGDTKIFREKNGKVEEVETVKGRVDRKHSKGGFSQGRFERKREKQIQSHLDQVKEVVEGLEEEIYLLGDESLCKKIPGKYLGGFDPNTERPEQFYSFRLYYL
ncbi:MAG: Vms1/Ankzf1 family peptidyl-tRNA hydrolase [Candidatus Nanohalobium sp.]